MENFNIDEEKYRIFFKIYFDWLEEPNITEWAMQYNSQLARVMMDEKMFALFCYKHYFQNYIQARDDSKYKGLTLLTDLNLIDYELKTSESQDDTDTLYYFLEIAKRLSFLGNRLFLMGYSSATLENEFTFKLGTKGNVPQEANQPMPFKIALLSELGFFDLPALKQLSKEKQNKIVKLLIGGDERSIKGNISVLDPNSEENRLKYTSNNYIDTVKNHLK